MNFYVATAFSFCIFIPGIIAAALFKRIDSRFYPFLYCLWIGCVNEVLSFLLIIHHHPNLMNNNIYVFIESLLLTWYFFNTGLFQKKARLYIVLGVLILTWTLENFVFGNIHVNSTYFRVVASLVIVTMSIEVFNRIISSYNPNIIRNSEFLLCSCFIIYFSYKALIQAFIIYGVTRNANFFVRIYIILVYINLVVNILYIPAVLWLPRKTRFILRLS